MTWWHPVSSSSTASNAINIIDSQPFPKFRIPRHWRLPGARPFMVILASAYTNFYFGPPRHHLQWKNSARMTPSLANNNAEDHLCTVQYKLTMRHQIHVRYHVYALVSRGRIVHLRFTDSSIHNCQRWCFNHAAPERGADAWHRRVQILHWASQEVSSRNGHSRKQGLGDLSCSEVHIDAIIVLGSSWPRGVWSSQRPPLKSRSYCVH